MELKKNLSTKVISSLKFPRLTSFTWCIELDDEVYEEAGPVYAMNYNSSIFDWIYDLTASVFGVKELRIHSTHELGTWFVQKLNDFTNLEKLCVKYGIPLGLRKLSFTRPLKTLELNYVSPENIPGFEKLL